MLCIQDRNLDPYFNLAAEEYVLKNFTDDVFMLWRNDNAIIVGKHQNTLSEINLDYVKEKGIKVVRRISGGGAVFHDLGNLNFTFIRTGEEGNLVDFKKFTLPIIEVLQKMGVNAKFEGRNDLTIEGKKFSGNAEHVWKNRTLHHGTILFSSVISDLTKALKVNPLKFKDKAVKSIRSRVTNVSEHLEEKMDVTDFSNRIMKHIMEKYEDSEPYEFTPDDIKKIEEIRDEKFGKWEWNFGYSPKYNFQRLIKTNGGTVEFYIDVEKGIMKDVKIYGDFFHKYDIEVVEKSLSGVHHDPDAIKDILSEFEFEDYFKNIDKQEFISGMF
ncbi:MAG: lipoate--protein ligase [Bacteroidales bacterium]